MEVVWKDLEVDLFQDLTCLTRFGGAYASTTIDKIIEFYQLFKEKDESILQLEEELLAEKKSVNEQLQVQVSQLKQSLHQL